MRKHPICKAERFRVRLIDGQPYIVTGNSGPFQILMVNGSTLNLIVSDGGGWDHVSVSVLGEKRCPTWEEMCFVKDLFFRDDEVALQYHPAKKDYVNCHPFTLHLWRPQTEEERKEIATTAGDELPEEPTAAPVPMPPKVMV